jgi:hypothetical protein
LWGEEVQLPLVPYLGNRWEYSRNLEILLLAHISNHKLEVKEVVTVVNKPCWDVKSAKCIVVTSLSQYFCVPRSFRLFCFVAFSMTCNFLCTSGRELRTLLCSVSWALIVTNDVMKCFSLLMLLRLSILEKLIWNDDTQEDKLKPKEQWFKRTVYVTIFYS